MNAKKGDKGSSKSNFEQNLDIMVKHGYRIYLSNKTEDKEWDDFLVTTPGGHHAQTSLWAQLKDSIGWRAVRIIIKDTERIVAGAQLLIRPIPMIGGIGYIHKGPLFALGFPVLKDLIIHGVQRVINTYHIRYLTVQPPKNGETFTQQLPRWNFQKSSLGSVGPQATTLIDLELDLEAILDRMKPKTRYNIRLGERKGIIVREGKEHDLSTFYRLLMVTGQRQNFPSNSYEYFYKIWRIFSPYGYLKLFLAEYQDEAVSSLLAIPFGDTVTYWRGGWSSYHGNRRPNEILHWTAIKWAKSHGYRYYDFEGIDPIVAKTLMDGKSLAKESTETVTRFKLGFGGRVIFLPDNYDYIPNPSIRWIYQQIDRKMAHWSVFKKGINFLRTHW